MKRNNNTSIHNVKVEQITGTQNSFGPNISFISSCVSPRNMLSESSCSLPGRVRSALKSWLIITVALVSVVFGATQATAQQFSDVGAGLPGILPGAVAWGDYDNDGKLDLLLTGSSTAGFITEIWHNDGNGKFSKVKSLAGLFKSTAAWGDYDNDGLLDVVIAGLDSNLLPQCQVWHNQGNGNFVQSGILLPGISGGVVAWADFDNDGNLDLLLSGTGSGGNALTQIWRNRGDGTFANLNAGLTPLKLGAVALADFDNDGKMDLVLTGMGPNNVPVAQIWRNQGNGTFTQINAGLTGVYGGSVATGDYDNDGRTDFFVTGLNASGQAVSQLWHNNGNFSFSSVNSGLPAVYLGKVAWGDFDNDGLTDILLSGYNASRQPSFQLWSNRGGGTFANANVGLPGLGSSAIAWGDFDNDNKLDIVFAGFSPQGYVTQILRNLTSQVNDRPAAPTGLSVALTGTGVTLNWQQATDPENPSVALTYNVRLGTTSGGSDLISPSSDLATGLLRVPQPGNLGQGLSASFNLPLGVYYWSVQAVDSNFKGSLFAPENSFILAALVTTGAPSQVGTSSAILNGSVNPRGATTTAWFEWGTTTAYGNQLPSVPVGNGTTSLPFTQVLSSLKPNTTYHVRLAASDAFGVVYGGDQTFTTDPAQTPPSTTGLTTNVNVLVPGGSTTQLQFTQGVLTGVVPQ